MSEEYKELSEEDFEMIKGIIEGNKDCIEIELRNYPDNTEDIEHWQKEIKALENLLNVYYREKGRANRLEEILSRALTKLEEKGVDVINDNFIFERS